MSSVYKAISAVSSYMSREGIGKNRKNDQQGYNFRGIDDVLNALSSALDMAGLVILPRVTERQCVERTTANGRTIFYVTVRVDFDLIAVEDGSTHTVTTYGEAMDSADKATNKAMSAAYKYLALLTFCIPVEGTPETDADYTTHEVKAAKAPPSPQKAAEYAQGATDMLQSLQDCAMAGKAALEREWNVWKQKATTGNELDVATFDAVWTEHKPSLMAAAKKADAKTPNA